jgi:uncharacterized protein (TIGR00730 family)
MAAATLLGKTVGSSNISLVYGGGNVGMMGAVARAVLASGGKVTGIIPKSLTPRELSGDMLGEAVVVESMHERKKMMYSLCDAFIALPGGVGTFEELLEVITWQQLGIHNKPIGVLNVEGYFQPILDLLSHGVDQGFIDENFGKQVLCVDSDPEKLLAKLRQHAAPASNVKWLTEDQV